MKAVRSHFTIAALLFFLGICAGENPIQASNGAEQSSRHRHYRWLSESYGNEPNTCFFGYGSGPGSTFYIGFTGQDQGSFGGATGTFPVCLAELESTPIIDSITDSSPSLGDGIVGLEPGCTNTEDIDMTCANNETDVVSSLVKSGAISSFQFTMCFEETGGNLFLGPGQYPESTMWFPAVPFQATFSGGTGTDWTFQGPSNEGSVGILARGANGNEETIGEITTTAFETNYVDSGTGGVVFPSEYKRKILSNIANAWADDKDATEILRKSTEHEKLDLLDLPQDLLSSSITLSKEDADYLNSLVPDIIYQGLDGGDLVFAGSTFLYEAYPSSGYYFSSWSFGTYTAMGTGFLLNKTVVFDNSNPLTPRIGIVPEQARDCNEHDYSEKGNIIKMSAPGGLSNVLATATYLGEIELGGQKLLVQLDTGSADFALPNKPSCMQMDEESGECLDIDDGFSDFGDVIAAYVKDGDHCSKYVPLIAKYNNNDCDGDNGNDNNDDCRRAYVGSMIDLLRILMEDIQPYATCEAQREFCGDLKQYHKDLSPSFQYLPIGSDLTLDHWVKQPAQYSLDQNHGTCSLIGVMGDTDDITNW